jgi:hypothetical protein
MERRRGAGGLMQDSAIIYFDASTSASSYQEILDSLGREMSPVRTLDLRCVDFDTATTILPVDPLLEMMARQRRTQLKRVMLTYPENWPAHKARALVDSMAQNPNIQTVWLTEIQSFTDSLNTILTGGGLINVTKLLLSLDQLRSSSQTLRQRTAEALRVHLETTAPSQSTVTLCYVRFDRATFAPIAQGINRSAHPPCLELRWCSFDQAAMEMFQSLYTQGRSKTLSISFESIRNPFPVKESTVFRHILGANSSIVTLKLDTFLKGMTDFSLILDAIQASRHIRSLSLLEIDSPEKYRATARILPKMPALTYFSFSVGEIQVPRGLMIEAIHASITLERVNGTHFDNREKRIVERICTRNKRFKEWMDKPFLVEFHLWPKVYAAASKCENGQNLILKSLLFLGDSVGPQF